MKVFDGKKEALKLEGLISNKVSDRSLQGHLGMLMIGDDLVSEKFVNYKIALCKKFFIPWRFYRINDDLSDSDIEIRFRHILMEDNLQGLIVQLPLPRESLYYLLNLIPLNKDLDLLSSKSMTQYRENRSLFIPPVVRALSCFLAVNKIKKQGMTVAVLGGGRLVGEPIAYFLANNKAKVTVMDEDNMVRSRLARGDRIKIEKNYHSGKLLNADLVVAATGKAHLIKGEDLAPGTHLIDFGSVVKEGKIVGNFDRDSQREHLGYVSLVPGGMGPLVVRYLLLNFLSISNIRFQHDKHLLP